jgi:hypothetical protein
VQNSKPNIGNLKNCIEDVKRAALENDLGPEDPTNYNQLRGRLEASRNKFPPIYRDAVSQPYISKLNEIGETGFTSILIRDPTREGLAGLMLDIAHAIVQNGEEYNAISTDSFQEVVSDLYDGFLSAEDRRGINPPDKGVIPPLVKWGNPDFGPYTWPVDATASFDVKAGIVNLPPSNARSGLLAWAALGHETAGHDILHADTGTHEALSSAVQTGLEDQKLKDGLPEYWSSRIDETASDVLGILNMGPTAGLGIVGYFRGLNVAFGGEPKLRNEGGAGDPHPADILRGYLAAYTVSLLSFEGAADWAQVIESETNKDLSTILLEDNKVSPEIAKKSAKIVASTIFGAKLPSLENHAFGEIQNWRDLDEGIVKDLIPILTTASQLPTRLVGGIYAAHVVAAAVEAAISKDADISSIFSRMLSILKTMHDANPSWGPLFIRHPGNTARHLAYSFSTK